MDIKIFRKLVNDSPIKDKLSNLKIILNYPHLESKFELDGIQSIYKFIYDQVIGWNHIENIPDYLSYSKRHFETTISLSFPARICKIYSVSTSSNSEMVKNK